MTRFVIVAGIAFALLLAGSRPLGGAYSAFFRATVEASFAVLGIGPAIEVRAQHAADGPHDTRLCVAEPDGANAWFITADSRGAGYLPSAVLLALVLASPIAWRLRLRACMLGGLFVHAFIVAQLGANLLRGFGRHFAHCRTPELHSRAWIEGWRADAVQLAIAGVQLEPTVFLIVPVLAWLLTCFRRDDWRELVLAIQPKPRARPLLDLAPPGSGTP